MKSDMEDPNNHVPEISEDDDWDVSDEPEEIEKSNELPKATAGLPGKKVSKGLAVTHHEPSLKDVSDESTDFGETVLGKTDGRDEGVDSDTVSEEEEGSENEVDEKRIVLPPATDKKRFKVVELGAGDTRLTPHVQLASALKPKLVANLEPEISESGEEEPEESHSSHERQTAEKSEWGKSDKTQSAKWIVFSGMGILFALLLMALGNYYVRGRQKTNFDEFGYSKMAAVLEDELVDFEAEGDFLENVTNREEEASVIYAEFAAAEKAEEVKGLIWNADEEFPFVEKHFKPIGSNPGWTPLPPLNWVVSDAGDFHFCNLRGLTEDFEKFSAYFRLEGDKLKIDWKATTEYSTATFTELKTGKADASEVRGWLSQANFYTFSLPEETYRSFRLMSPDASEAIWVYTKRDTELEKRLIEPFQARISADEMQDEAQMVVELEASPEGALPSQWLVKDLVNMSWLTE
ncbi:MAG: hypothetical protein ACSHX7_08175 [Luteolibacter sp.]